MRVLHVCSYYGNKFYRLLFDAIEHQGIDQTIYYFATKGTNDQQLSEDVCYRECYSNLDRLTFYKKEKRVERALKESIDIDQYDLIHAHSLFSNGYIAWKIHQQYQINYIVAVRNSDIYSFFRLRPWLRSLGNKILADASVIVFLSPNHKNIVVRKYINKSIRSEVEKKCIVIPNGIDKIFLSNPPCQELISREESDRLQLIQVGDINYNKNQIRVAIACKKLIKNGFNLSYLVVGKVKNPVVAQVLRLFPFVKMLPATNQSKIVELFRQSNVFVMASRHETFGLSYIEAMSQGLPIIYSKGQGVYGYFMEGEVGYSVNYHKVSELYKQLQKCLIQPKDSWNKNIQIAKSFNWQDIAKRYVDIYKRHI